VRPGPPELRVRKAKKARELRENGDVRIHRAGERKWKVEGAGLKLGTVESSYLTLSASEPA
jgi:hypothetical protein